MSHTVVTASKPPASVAYLAVRVKAVDSAIRAGDAAAIRYELAELSQVADILSKTPLRLELQDA